MTRARWLLGAALVVLSLVAAFRALGTYVQHGLWLASATVMVLGAIAVAGFASLAIARRRLTHELRGLALEPPSSTLFDDRRRRLEAIHASGGEPDREALAQATAAEETGRAYLGRYFVAVTVLVGLVGTFAGLMETLRGVAPLLADDKADTLKLIAAPLAGLDVTFGASIVGVLVTLALALVQGDLVIAEEIMLARLEERTTHVLLPSLWPPAEQAMERAAGELAALRRELAGALASAMEGAGNRVAEAAERALLKMVGEVKVLLASSVEGTSREVRLGLGRAAEDIEAKVRPLLVEGAAEIELLRSATAAASAKASEAITEATRRAVADLERAATEIAVSLRHGAEAAALAQERTEAALVKLSEGHALRLEGTAGKLLAAAERSTAEHARRLEAVAAGLERAGLDAVAAHERLAEQAAAHASALVAAGSAGAERAEAALAELGRAQAAGLDATARTLLGIVENSIKEQTATVETLAVTLQDTAARTVEAQERSLGQAGAQANALAVSCAALAADTQAHLAALSEAHAGRLDALANTLLATVERSVTAHEAQLLAAAGSLTQAAEALRDGADQLAPAAAALAPELGALSREVALLAARAEASQEQAAVVEELGRLGEGVEKLERLAHAAAKEPA